MQPEGIRTRDACWREESESTYVACYGYWMTSARILREQWTRILDRAGSRELAGPVKARVRSLRLEVGEGYR
jgi:hypothetical protein